jgi:hypothetical protein
MSEARVETGRVITLKDLNRLRTPRGGYTRQTLKVLGVSWPPVKGWKTRLVGKPLPDAAARLLSSFKEETRPEDDGVIWEKAYTVTRDGPLSYVRGPGTNVVMTDSTRAGDDDVAEAWAHRLNVAYNAGRNAARRK